MPRPDGPGVPGFRTEPDRPVSEMEMSNRIQMVRLLADGRFHSGQEIADRLGISRTAVWKQLQRVKRDYGLDVHAVRGRGYRLAAPLDLLDREAIVDACRRLAPPVRVEVLDRIDSTNRYLMQRSREALASGSVCLAEQQTAGRGRRGRTWVSPFGRNLYLSVFWRYDLEMAALTGLSLAAGVAVAECLDRLGVPDLSLKWPNDLHWRGRKLGGLLLEASGEQGGPAQVVLGLGLNLHMEEEHGQAIDQPWVALSHIPGAPVLARNRIAGEVIAALVETMGHYQHDGLTPFLSRWERYDGYLGQPVVLHAGERRITGIHRGVDSRGALMLDSNGTVSAHFGGEVSLRKAGSQGQ